MMGTDGCRSSLFGVPLGGDHPTAPTLQKRAPVQEDREANQYAEVVSARQ